MKQINLELSYGFSYGYSAEESVEGIEISDELYKFLKEVYFDTGENELNSIWDMEGVDEALKIELERTIKNQRDELIELQYENGDDCDPDTGEEYNFNELLVDIYIKVPGEWEE